MGKGKGKGMMDRRRHQSNPIHAGEFVTDVVLWRRGRADLSALLLAAAVASWILFHAASGYNYTAVSLAADVLLLLLAVLYAWSRAAPPRPSPTCTPLPTSSRRSSIPASPFSPPPSAASPRASPAPAASSPPCSAGSRATSPPCATLRSYRRVGALTIPALYQRFSVERYARLASLNLYRYELFSLTCYLRARDYLIELLKEQP